MKRFEIICDATIENIFIEGLDKMEGLNAYTYLAPVDGNGQHGPRRGSHVWPEENAMLILYIEDIYSDALIEYVKSMRSRFPNNGLACFYIETAHAI